MGSTAAAPHSNGKVEVPEASEEMVGPWDGLTVEELEAVLGELRQAKVADFVSKQLVGRFQQRCWVAQQLLVQAQEG